MIYPDRLLGRMVFKIIGKMENLLWMVTKAHSLFNDNSIFINIDHFTKKMHPSPYCTLTRMWDWRWCFKNECASERIDFSMQNQFVYFWKRATCNLFGTGILNRLRLNPSSIWIGYASIGSSIFFFNFLIWHHMFVGQCAIVEHHWTCK